MKCIYPKITIKINDMNANYFEIVRVGGLGECQSTWELRKISQ